MADLALPKVSPEQERAFLAAERRYGAAIKAAEARLDEFEAKWALEVKDLKERKEQVTTLKKLRFRESKPGFFDDVEAEVDAAAIEAQKFRPVAAAWVKAVERITGSMNSAMRGSTANMWLYEASFSGLQVVKDCAKDGPGWTKWTFTRGVSSEQTRTGQWNGGGGWDGTFLQINAGASGSDYSHVLTTGDESISIGFCNLQYLPVSPSAWWDIGLLQAIDAGEILLKPESPYYKKRILGPNGAVPRLVKGLIVARSMQIEANLGTTMLSEYKKSISGSGGIRIGPWNIGGGGGGTEFRKESQNETGGYVRSTDTTVPVIIAVVTETTSDK